MYPDPRLLLLSSNQFLMWAHILVRSLKPLPAFMSPDLLTEVGALLLGA